MRPVSIRRTLILLLALLLPASAAAQSSYEQLGAFSDVLNYVRNNYADSVGYSDLVRAAIGGMLRSLDPHSYFLPRAEFARQQSFERGDLASVGFGLELVEGRLTVVGILDGGPADRGHIQAGDRLAAIEDTSVAGLTAEEVEVRLSGDRGTRVRLLFERGAILDPDSFRVTIRRETIRPRGVTLATMADSVTGYIRLAEFTLTAGTEIDSSLRVLKRRGMRQAILDLRGNGGGIVLGAITSASLFLPKGAVIFREHGRRGPDVIRGVLRDGDWRTLPLIVLIDEGTASASEGLSGALQDNDRAVLIGRRSFGKALIQTPFLLQTGDVIYLTTAHVLTPSGRSIQRRYVGIGREQYYTLRGTAGDPNDTLAVFYSAAGRPLRGGGGIIPDIEMPPQPLPPAWWVVAVDSGFNVAVADSVAQTIWAAPASQERWTTDSNLWRTAVLAPFLERVRTRLHIPAVPDPGQELRIAQILANRVAEVRWGADGAASFRLRNDAGVRAALAAFPRLPTLLAPTRP